MPSINTYFSKASRKNHFSNLCYKPGMIRNLYYSLMRNVRNLNEVNLVLYFTSNDNQRNYTLWGMLSHLSFLSYNVIKSMKYIKCQTKGKQLCSFQVTKAVLWFLAMQQLHLQGSAPLCEHHTHHTHIQLQAMRKGSHLIYTLHLNVAIGTK